MINLRDLKFRVRLCFLIASSGWLDKNFETTPWLWLPRYFLLSVALRFLNECNSLYRKIWQASFTVTIIKRLWCNYLTRTTGFKGEKFHWTKLIKTRDPIVHKNLLCKHRLCRLNTLHTFSIAMHYTFRSNDYQLLVRKNFSDSTLFFTKYGKVQSKNIWQSSRFL